MNAITITNLTKTYGKNRGINQVDLRIEEGDFFGFIGPNGAGKSTTIRILLGLIRASSGQANIFGHDVWTEHVDCMQSLGYLPSETHFYPSQTVGEVLRLAAKLHHTDCREQSRYLCEQLQLDTTRKVSELSFGNRKKVGIVAAMQHRPKLLILDEPTSGLDPLMQHTFFDLLSEYNQSGTTIFMSSHILSEVQNNCRHAAIIREGKIVACDSVEALLATKARKLTIAAEDISTITQMAGVSQVEKVAGQWQLIYEGDLRLLLRTLEQMAITDLTITEPNLEEIFMHYYK